MLAVGPRRLRGRHLLALDTLGLTIAAFTALVLVGADLAAGPVPAAMASVALIVVIRTGVDVRAGLYTHDWRFASVPDLVRIVLAAAIGSLCAVIVFAIMSVAARGVTDAVPLAFWPIEAMLAVAVVGVSRFAIRAATDFALARPATDDAIRPTLLYGAGQVGVMVARSASRTPTAGVVPVGFLDDDKRLWGRTVAGHPVYGGAAALSRAVTETGAKVLLITAANIEGGTIRRIMDAGTALGLDVRTMPSMVELLNGQVDAHRVRKIQVEDLLRRPTTTQHALEVNDAFRDRTVLITGAGGSIGSELARQVMAVRPRRLVLLDRAESALFDIHRQLLEGFRDSDVEIEIELANVASRPAIRRVVMAARPDVILHAAAYKHVPMMEKHPSDAVYVNIAGTMALLDAAVEADVERFVLVSTDKAVKPSSIMGASKRVAEMLVADTARRTSRAYVSVRFGNVLGSNGSVVPIFADQLERGRPLTITHPEMTRYFMTIPEASWLILDAAALGRPGDLFVLDMGEPIRIMDLARDVARLAGRDPDAQPITITGLRPGEKLHEELFYDRELVEGTSTPKVLRAIADPPPTDIRAQVGKLMDYATSEHDEELRAELAAIVGGIQRQAAPAERPEPVAIPVVTEAAKSRTETALHGV